MQIRRVRPTPWAELFRAGVATCNRNTFRLSGYWEGKQSNVKFVKVVFAGATRWPAGDQYSRTSTEPGTAQTPREGTLRQGKEGNIFNRFARSPPPWCGNNVITVRSQKIFSILPFPNCFVLHVYGPLSPRFGLFHKTKHRNERQTNQHCSTCLFLLLCKRISL